MFSIGDKIFYPGYGAGIIQSIQEKEVLGTRKKYYILNIVTSNMEIMIPLDNMEMLGVRHIIDEDEVEKVLTVLGIEYTGTIEKWSKRFRENSQKIKTGDIYEIANVIRDISYQEGKKGISTGEKKMLIEAKEMLVGEVALALNKTNEEIMEIVNNKIKHD